MEFGPTTGQPFRIQQTSGGGDFAITDLSNNNLGTGTLDPQSNDILLVWRIDFGAGSTDDNLTLYLNPTSETSSSISLSSTRDVAFDRITMRGVGTTNDFTYDELRFGTTFSDVTPIPEPGVYALALSLVAGGMAFLKRRRKA